MRIVLAYSRHVIQIAYKGAKKVKLLRNMSIICLLGILLFAACSGRGKVTAEDTNRMEELGNLFVAEVNDLLPMREAADRLQEQEVVLSTEDKTYNIQYLRQFYEDYQAGSPAEVLTVFKTKTFVVTKVVYEQEKGYYFRYEFDKFNEDNITVTSQVLDSVEIKEDTALKKAEFTLYKDKKTPIVFTYKNIVDEK